MEYQVQDSRWDLIVQYLFCLETAGCEVSGKSQHTIGNTTFMDK